jgi:hypothetical protein
VFSRAAGRSLRRSPKLSVAVFVVALALPGSAFGQATRTWVSGVGDDANPCSRTAPCKTWAGAISKTFIGGEIDALDPGGYGGVTITKSITLDGGGTFASILASGFTGVIVNIASGNANDPHQKVVLRNLSINGTGASGAVGTNTGINGIRVDAAKDVRVENLRIFNFGTGIDFTPASTPTRLIVDNTTIADNTNNGILASPGTTGTSGAANRVTLRDTRIYGNGADGIHTNNTPGPNKVSVNVFRSLIADNGVNGLLSDGSDSRFRISGNDISGNVTGLQSINGGRILSWGDNHIGANNIDGAPTGMLTPG